MDAATLNTVVGVVGIIVGIVGIVIGVIGWRSLSAATKIKNSAKADHGGTVYQAKTIHQGVSDETVRLISKDITREQLCQLIIRLVPIHTDNEKCIGNRLRNGSVTSDMFETVLNEIPTFYYGEKEPPDFPKMKDADIWLQI